jgi:fumarylacetoacetase
LTVAEGDAAIFGYVLLNDWSARDIQAWEYQPLGPFQSKATATSLSPWIVTAAALAPFRVPLPPRRRALLPYLETTESQGHDIALEVALTPQDGPECVIARTNARELYYSAAQQVAHHSVSGCPMRTGDLLGSGTISGPTPDSRGALLELAWGGQTPIQLSDGSTRSFLHDHDTVTLRGAALGDGFRIGFGACTGKVLPAHENPYAR